MNINKKKYIIMGIGCLLILVCGITYAYLINNNSGKINNFIALDNIDIEYIDGESINSSDFQIPMKDSEVLEYAPSYSFTVKNNYKDKVYLKFKLTNLNIDSTNKEVYDDGNLRYMLYNGDEKIASGTIANYNEQTKEITLLTNYEQESNISKTYKLYVYIKDTWQNQNHFINKNIIGKIRVEGYDKKLPTLASKIIENNPIDINTPDFSKVATTDEGLIRGEDSDGYTYYFRGDVKDNYVKIGDLKWINTYFLYLVGLNGTYNVSRNFISLNDAESECNTSYKNYGYISANECTLDIYKYGHNAGEDMLWRVVRVNGDGTIRLVANESIGSSQYNNKNNSEEYVGYTYKEHIGYEKSTEYEQSYILYDLNTSYYYSTSYTFDTSTGEYILDDPQLYTSEECINQLNLCSNKYTSFSNTDTKNNKLFYINSVSNYDNKIRMEYKVYRTKGKAIFDETSEEIDSTMKIYLENWYNNNLSKYDNILANSKFCNDTSIYGISSYQGSLNFGAYNRVTYSHIPQFTCSNTNEFYGGEYNLKIGLLTSDELMFAGGIWNSGGGSLNSKNNKFYLFGLSDLFFTFSPASFYGSATLFNLNNFSGIEYGGTVKDTRVTVPVINIKADVLYEIGDGTIDNPYQIQNI